jgi:hypothetical protein
MRILLARQLTSSQPLSLTNILLPYPDKLARELLDFPNGTTVALGPKEIGSLDYNGPLR